jgi:mannosylglycerate hydrolase
VTESAHGEDPAPPGAAVAPAPGLAPAPGRVSAPLLGARATDGYRFWVVAHSHWDREWPLPYRDTQLRLAEMLDEVLDVLESDPRFRSFTLDGQAAALEDYLELRPGAVHRVRRAIEGGRLLVGPSYVIPDEFLASGESLVRNLQLGRRVCLDAGGPPMSVGYLPDSFGHVAQLPQILRGFGLDAFVFWRGLGDEAERLGAIFGWAAPDGSEVLAIRQVGGYGSLAELGRWGGLNRWGDLSEPLHDRPERWPAAASAWVERYVETFRDEFEASANTDLLVCNGYDHTRIQRDLPDLLDHVAADHAGATFRIASYPEFVQAVRPTLPAPARFAGELCGGRYASVFRSVNSTRMWIKQENEEAGSGLLVAETITALAELASGAAGGGAHQDVSSPGSGAVPLAHDALRIAWRELLRNQSHDSISGSSVDEVDLDMRGRFAAVRTIAGRLSRQALARLSGTVPGWTDEDAPAAEVSVVNVLPFGRRGTVRVRLPRELANAARLTAEADGAPIRVQILASDPTPMAILGVTLPGLSATTVRLTRTEAPAGAGEAQFAAGEAQFAAGEAQFAAGEARVVGERTIENGLVRVTVEHDASLTVTDLRTGRSIRGVHRFEDVADKGDLYTFCPLPGDGPDPVAPVEEIGVGIPSRGPVVVELEVSLRIRLPAELTAGRSARSAETVECPVRTVVSLMPGSDRIGFRTTLVNRARDHRLRVLWPCLESIDAVRAEGAFGVIHRPPEPVWRGSGWREAPARTHHTAGGVAAGGLALLTRGLPEVAALRLADGTSALALTLLRCVDAISRHDLEVRPGHVGPPYRTPGAQGLGEHTFEYALDLGAAASDDLALLRASQDFRVALVTGPAGVRLPTPSIRLDGVAFSALKPADDGDGIVLRVFAPAGRAGGTVGVMSPDICLERCRLDETPLDPDAVSPTANDAVPVAPGAIVTFRLRPRSDART